MREQSPGQTATRKQSPEMARLQGPDVAKRNSESSGPQLARSISSQRPESSTSNRQSSSKQRSQSAGPGIGMSTAAGTGRSIGDSNDGNVENVKTINKRSESRLGTSNNMPETAEELERRLDLVKNGMLLNVATNATVSDGYIGAAAKGGSLGATQDVNELQYVVPGADLGPKKLGLGLTNKNNADTDPSTTLSLTLKSSRELNCLISEFEFLKSLAEKVDFIRTFRQLKHQEVSEAYALVLENSNRELNGYLDIMGQMQAFCDPQAIRPLLHQKQRTLKAARENPCAQPQYLFDELRTRGLQEDIMTHIYVRIFQQLCVAQNVSDLQSRQIQAMKKKHQEKLEDMRQASFKCLEACNLELLLKQEYVEQLRKENMALKIDLSDARGVEKDLRAKIDQQKLYIERELGKNDALEHMHELSKQQMEALEVSLFQSTEQLDKDTRAYKHQIDAQKNELHKHKMNQQKAIHDLKQKHDENTMALRDHHQGHIENLILQHQQNMANVIRRHSEEKEALLCQHESIMDECRASIAQHVSDLQEEHEQRIATLQDQHAEHVSNLIEKHEKHVNGEEIEFNKNKSTRSVVNKNELSRPSKDRGAADIDRSRKFLNQGAADNYDFPTRKTGELNANLGQSYKKHLQETPNVQVQVHDLEPQQREANRELKEQELQSKELELQKLQGELEVATSKKRENRVAILQETAQLLSDEIRELKMDLEGLLNARDTPDRHLETNQERDADAEMKKRTIEQLKKSSGSSSEEVPTSRLYRSVQGLEKKSLEYEKKKLGAEILKKQKDIDFLQDMIRSDIDNDPLLNLSQTDDVNGLSQDQYEECRSSARRVEKKRAKLQAMQEEVDYLWALLDNLEENLEKNGFAEEYIEEKNGFSEDNAARDAKGENRNRSGFEEERGREPEPKSVRESEHLSLKGSGVRVQKSINHEAAPRESASMQARQYAMIKAQSESMRSQNVALEPPTRNTLARSLRDQFGSAGCQSSPGNDRQSMRKVASESSNGSGSMRGSLGFLDQEPAMRASMAEADHGEEMDQRMSGEDNAGEDGATVSSILGLSVARNRDEGQRERSQASRTRQVSGNRASEKQLDFRKVQTESRKSQDKVTKLDSFKPQKKTGAFNRSIDHLVLHTSQGPIPGEKVLAWREGVHPNPYGENQGAGFNQGTDLNPGAPTRTVSRDVSSLQPPPPPLATTASQNLKLLLEPSLPAEARKSRWKKAAAPVIIRYSEAERRGIVSATSGRSMELAEMQNLVPQYQSETLASTTQLARPRPESLPYESSGVIGGSYGDAGGVMDLRRSLRESSLVRNSASEDPPNTRQSFARQSSSRQKSVRHEFQTVNSVRESVNGDASGVRQSAVQRVTSVRQSTDESAVQKSLSERVSERGSQRPSTAQISELSVSASIPVTADPGTPRQSRARQSAVQNMSRPSTEDSRNVDSESVGSIQASSASFEGDHNAYMELEVTQNEMDDEVTQSFEEDAAFGIFKDDPLSDKELENEGHRIGMGDDLLSDKELENEGDRIGMEDDPLSDKELENEGHRIGMEDDLLWDKELENEGDRIGMEDDLLSDKVLENEGHRVGMDPNEAAAMVEQNEEAAMVDDENDADVVPVNMRTDQVTQQNEHTEELFELKETGSVRAAPSRKLNSKRELKAGVMRVSEGALNPSAAMDEQGEAAAHVSRDEENDGAFAGAKEDSMAENEEPIAANEDCMASVNAETEIPVVNADVVIACQDMRAERDVIGGQTEDAVELEDAVVEPRDAVPNESNPHYRFGGARVSLMSSMQRKIRNGNRSSIQREIANGTGSLANETVRRASSFSNRGSRASAAMRPSFRGTNSRANAAMKIQRDEVSKERKSAMEATDTNHLDDILGDSAKGVDSMVRTRFTAAEVHSHSEDEHSKDVRAQSIAKASIANSPIAKSLIQSKQRYRFRSAEVFSSPDTDEEGHSHALMRRFTAADVHSDSNADHRMTKSKMRMLDRTQAGRTPVSIFESRRARQGNLFESLRAREGNPQTKT